ncbi:MAG: efflux RND transporter periplasmic adaptor subunit [Oscillospiraceae bacterium]|nr:efflux RND transporter periplasmic adaptor subunit [Oscillospiraceae bacterium]MBR7038718.1 efflux RND transporter periplasmic adaptor subunit [Oscillospiraceae bacterium]
MEQAKKKKAKPIIILIIVIVVLAAIIIGIVGCSKMLSDSISQLSAGMTELSTVERRDITNDISVSGQVQSENLVKITSTTAAKVKTVYAEVGKEVKEGEILLEFDSSDLQTQYDSLKKSIQNNEDLTAHTHEINVRNLENAKRDKENSLAQARRGIEKAENARNQAHNKEGDLVNKYNNAANYVNELSDRLNNCDPEQYEQLAQELQAARAELSGYQSALDQIRDSFSTYDDAVQSAHDAYDQAERTCDMSIQGYQDVIDNEQFTKTTDGETELKKLEDAIKDCTVRAPKSGIITSVNVAEGSIPTTDALMTIENKDALKITVSIAEADILKVQEGQKCIVKTTATGDQEFSATVSRVVNIYSPGQMNALGQTTGGGYSAEITIDDTNTGLLIGMTAKVQILLEEKKDVLTVPYESIKEDDQGKRYVLLAVTDEKTGVSVAKRADIETGMEGSYYTEVVSGDIKVGDKIVMQGDMYNDGDTLLLMPNLNSMSAAESGAESAAESAEESAAESAEGEASADE